MRNLWSVAKLQFRLAVQNRGLLLMSLGLPLLFTLLMGNVLGGVSGGSHVYPVALVDQDGSFASQAVAAALQEERDIKLIPSSQADLRRLFVDRKIDSGLIIPAGFGQELAQGEAPILQMVSPPGGNLQVGVGPMVRRAALRVAQDYRLALTAAGPAAGEEAVKEAYARVEANRQAQGPAVEQREASRPVDPRKAGGPGLNEYALGFTVMFVMMMVFMRTGTILRERQDGTWGRILSSPVTRRSLMGGYLLSFFLAGMAQFAVLLAASTLLFRVHWGPILPLSAMASAFVLCSTGMGLFLAGIVRTPEQQGAVGTLVVSASSMLGGVYWPLDLVSETMRRVGYLTPQAWAMDGFRQVMLRGGGWNGLFWPITVLLLLAAIFTTAGLFRVRYD